MTQTRTPAGRMLAGRTVNPVGLGCMNLGHAYGVPLPEPEAERLLLAALDLGVAHFDTSRAYSAGRNEALVGRVLGPHRDRVLIASKMGIVVDEGPRHIDCSPAVIRRECEKSLRTLGVERIDLYYMHRPDFTVPIEESMGAMADLVAEGKIAAVGLSEMNSQTVRRAHAVFPVAAVQNEYSPWSRNVELGLLDATRELGIALVAFSPVGRGALPGTLRDVGALPEDDMRHILPRFLGRLWQENLVRIDRFGELARGAGVTPAQLALGWVLGRADNLHVIPGTSRRDHLAENCVMPDWRPDAALAAAVEALFPPDICGPRYSAGLQAQVSTEEFA